MVKQTKNIVKSYLQKLSNGQLAVGELLTLVDPDKGYLYPHDGSVHIYARGEQIAVHLRDYTPGAYTTVKEHLSSTHQDYKDRSPTVISKY